MKLLKTLALTAAVAAAAIAGTATAQAQERVALVVKSLGNGFFDAAAKGAEKAAAEIGGIEVIYTGPTSATAEGQIDIVNSLIAQNVDAIAISANDPDALVPVLEKAMERGIKVLSWDSGVAEAGRMLHLNPSDTNLIGETIIKLAADYLPDGGDVAILSASSTATNQNAWIAAAKEALPEKFPNINLVSVVYGDDDSVKSTNEAKGLCRRRSASSAGVRSERSSPSSRTLPAVGSSSPPTTFRSVVFPDPLGPASALNSPSATSRSTPSSARVTTPRVS